MECPFCRGEVKKDALACEHCARDLRVPESLMEENRELKNKVKELQATIAEAERELKAPQVPAVCLAFRPVAKNERPNPLAMRAALALGSHVGHQAIRRRAQRIQEMCQTVGPAVGIVATASASIYAGIRSLLPGL